MRVPLQGRQTTRIILCTWMTMSFILFAGAWLSVPALWMSWIGILLFSTLLMVYLRMVLTKNSTAKQAPD